ncbi:metallophosphoesterase [Rubrolithibacter danxiaensis]|uniref:metallophosphoesterase n=1 Tax=Rubrolithibacter danxiaensis TaxID=3390805 RepID=UPI003BF8A051
MPLQKTEEPFELFLIGDTGDISRSKPDPVIETLRSHFNPDQASAVIFLGDNIYPRGLPPKGNILRHDAELTLKQHHEALKDYHGKIVFISGNHDWNKGRKDGYEYVLRQEKYLQKLFEGRNIFLPSNGCPGPVEINISDKLTLVAIDTQWWMQKGFRPIGDQCGCRVSSEEEFFEHLINILEENKNKHLVVIGHHPVYSYAIHGGRFKLKHHIFPLTLYDENAWIPLPLIGSILPLYRKFLGAREDVSHPRYRRLRKRLKEIFAAYPNLIYAAGHEHNLQYICKENNHFLVSGSGSKTKYLIQSGKHLRFGIKCKGFFKVRFETDGSVFISAWVIDTARKKAKGNLVYEQQII